MTTPTNKRSIDECDFITSAIKRLAIEPQVANDQKMTKEPKRQSRTWLIKKQARMHTKQKDRASPKVPPKNSVSQINLEDQISDFLKSIRYSTKDNARAPGQSQTLASAEPSGAPGKMMSSARKDKKETCKPYQKERPVSKNSCELIPGPALRSATASSQENKDGDKSVQNPVPMFKLEEQISLFLKSVRYSGTEGDKVSVQSSDSTESKLKDFTGKMKSKEKDISKKSKPYMYIYKMAQKPKPKITAENNEDKATSSGNQASPGLSAKAGKLDQIATKSPSSTNANENYSNCDLKNHVASSTSATQCDNTRDSKRQSRKRQKDPSIATTCAKKHKVDRWTCGLESLIKDFKRLTLNNFSSEL